MIANIDRFQGVFDALSTTVIQDAERIIEKNTLLAESTLSELAALKYEVKETNMNLVEMLNFERERARDDARRAELDRVQRLGDTDSSTPSPYGTPSDNTAEEKTKGFFADLFDSFSNIPFSRILTAAFVAPFVYKFVEGFVENMTDGIVDISVAGIAGLSSMVQGKFGLAISSFANLLEKPIGAITKTIRAAVLSLSLSYQNMSTSITRIQDFVTGARTFMQNAIEPVRKVFTSFSGFATTLGKVGSFISKVFSAIPGSGTLKLLLGRLAWPITIFTGFVESVREFINTEGTLFDKFKAGVGTFFGEIVGAPLDLLKDIGAWVLKKFGFDETSEALQGFSFTQLIKDMVGGVFDFANGMISWVKGLITDPTKTLGDLWKTALDGFGSLTEMIFSPLQKFASWVSDIATVGLEGLNSLWQGVLGGSSSLGDLLFSSVKDFVTWVSDVASVGLEGLNSLWKGVLGGASSLGDMLFSSVKDFVTWVSDVASVGLEGLNSLWKGVLGGANSLSDLLFSSVKNFVTWVSDVASIGLESLNSLWQGVLGGASSLGDMIFSPIKDFISWAKSIFADPQEALGSLWSTALGGYTSLLDMIFYPLNKAVSWISKIFGWEEGEDFSLREYVLGAAQSAFTWIKDKFTWNAGDETEDASLKDMLTEWVDSLKSWFTGLLPELPSSDEIAKSFFNTLPNWMQKSINTVMGEEMGEEMTPEQIQTTNENIERLKTEKVTLETELASMTSKGDAKKKTEVINKIADIDSRIEEYMNDLPQMSKGSDGFVDFGKGTLAMLHNKEAVVPLDTPAGSFLESMFDNNWQPKIEQLTPVLPSTPQNNLAKMKQNYVVSNAEEKALEQGKVQSSLMNIAPNIMSSRPITTHKKSTTIINNISPARTLDDPSMLK